MAPVRLITTLLILTVAAPALAVVVTPTQLVFQTGDAIELSVFNDSNRTIQFPSSVPFVLHNLDTDEVFSFIALAVVLPLDPGNTAVFVVSSEELTSGTYKIILDYYDDDSWDKFIATANFDFEVVVDVLP